MDLCIIPSIHWFIISLFVVLASLYNLLASHSVFTISLKASLGLLNLYFILVLVCVISSLIAVKIDIAWTLPYKWGSISIPSWWNLLSLDFCQIYFIFISATSSFISLTLPSWLITFSVINGILLTDLCSWHSVSIHIFIENCL